MSAVNTEFYEKKKSQTFYAGLALLIIVLLITGGLYYYSHTLDKTIQENNSELKQVQSSISEIEQDAQVQIYSVYSQNKDIFTLLAEGSKIPSMVNHLKRVFSIQGIDYKGFSYSEGKVITQLSLETQDTEYAYEKVTKFLQNYRENEEGLFTISQISQFTGYDRINFEADLTLKK